MLSVQISISPLEGWTLEKLKASDSLWFSPLNSTKGNTGSVYRSSVIICGWRQRSGRKWGIRVLRLKSVRLWFRENKEREKETDWDGKLADYKIISGADLASLKLWLHFSSWPQIKMPQKNQNKTVLFKRLVQKFEAHFPHMLLRQHVYFLFIYFLQKHLDVSHSNKSLPSCHTSLVAQTYEEYICHI